MANISQIKKVPHVVTSAEAVASVAFIPILWESAFNDTNYAISWSIELVKASNFTLSEVSYFPQMSINVSRNGFTAVVNVFNTGVAGDTIVIHAMASHA